MLIIYSHNFCKNILIEHNLLEKNIIKSILSISRLVFSSPQGIINDNHNGAAPFWQKSLGDFHKKNLFVRKEKALLYCFSPEWHTFILSVWSTYVFCLHQFNLNLRFYHLWHISVNEVNMHSNYFILCLIPRKCLWWIVESWFLQRLFG